MRVTNKKTTIVPVTRIAAIDWSLGLNSNISNIVSILT